MTFVIAANALAVAAAVGLLVVVMRTGYLVAGRSPLVEPTPLPVDERETLQRAA